MNRRAALACTCLAALACLSRDPQVAGDASLAAPPLRLTIIATADIGADLEPVPPRGAGLGSLGGLARRAADLEASEAARPVIVDAGDTFFRAYRVEPHRRANAEATAAFLADTLHSWGVFAMAVGERDLALGLPALRRLGARADVALLSSNLVHASTGTAAFAGFAVARRPGLAIGFVGASPVLVPDDPAMEAYRLAGLRANPVGPAVARAAASARGAGADLVIALLHGGVSSASVAVAALPPGVVDAVVVGGIEEPATFDGPGLVWVAPGTRGRHAIHLRAVGRAPAWTWTSAVHALDDRVTESAPLADQIAELKAGLGAPPDAAARREYVGHRRCAEPCHVAALRHWSGSAHARAWARLVTTRQTNNLDCLGCHSTGFGRPGGPTTAAAAARLRNVGCEACHGPGRAHADDPEQPLAADPGGAQRCAECHRVQGDQRPFEHTTGLGRVIGPGHGAPAPR